MIILNLQLASPRKIVSNFTTNISSNVSSIKSSQIAMKELHCHQLTYVHLCVYVCMCVSDILLPGPHISRVAVGLVRCGPRLCTDMTDASVSHVARWT